MAGRQSITENMTVRSADGRKLGVIIRCNDQSFQIEKGIFFPDEYLADYSEVDRIQNGEAILKKEVRELRPLDPTGPEATGLVRSEGALEDWTLEREHKTSEGGLK